MHAMT